MLSRETLFEYRAWPSEKMPHIEALHHLFGRGVSDIRTDTYILSPHRPEWLMIVRGGTHFEIRVRTAVQDPVSVWTTPIRSAFPLPRHVVLTLQQAFPRSQLPRQICEPVDLLSWLGPSASICTLSQRMVHFYDGDCMAELTQLNTEGRRMETFCLSAKRYEPLVDILKMIPGPRLPNRDYGTWIQHRTGQGQPATPPTLEIEFPTEAAPQKPARSLPERASLYAAKSIPDRSAQFQKVVSLGRKAAVILRQRLTHPSLAPEQAKGTQRLGQTANDNTPAVLLTAEADAIIIQPVEVPVGLSTRLRISERQSDWQMTGAWTCSGDSVHIAAHAHRHYGAPVSPN